MSEIDVRDLRSDSRAYKRFRNISAKYNSGGRLVAGDMMDYKGKDLETATAREAGREQYKASRPVSDKRYVVRRRGPLARKASQPEQYLTTSISLERDTRGHNVTPKPGHSRRTFGWGHTGRVARAADATLESRDGASHSGPAKFERTLSKSMLDESTDKDILYSFEKQRSSPNADGKEVALDTLVDKAEEKWESEKTDRMVKEYEVLDRKGEKVRMSAKKGKGRESESQEESKGGGIEEEDFEVI